MYWNSSTVYNLNCTAAITKIQYAPAVVPASSLVLHTKYYCFLNKPCESCWARAPYSKNPRTHCRTSHAHTHALQQTPMMCIVHTNTCLVWMELIMWLFGFFMYILNGLYCINKGTVKRLTFTEVFFLNFTFLLSMHRLSNGCNLKLLPSIHKSTKLSRNVMNEEIFSSFISIVW